MDLDQYWSRDPKPAGYSVPEPYTKAKEDGQFEKIQQQYKAAFRSDPFAEVRKQCRGGGQDILS
jgi:ribose transport system substrate-binding protein